MTAPGYNAEKFRHGIERMPATEYLSTSYFEHWLHGVETLLMENGVLTAEEIAERMKKLEAHE